jgi:hypothetical protein
LFYLQREQLRKQDKRGAFYTLRLKNGSCLKALGTILHLATTWDFVLNIVNAQLDNANTCSDVRRG